jgi:hypothetical protein
MLSVFSLPKVYQLCRHIPVMIERLGQCISQITISKSWKDSLDGHAKKIASVCVLIHRKLHTLTPKRSYSTRQFGGDVRSTTNFNLLNQWI